MQSTFFTTEISLEISIFIQLLKARRCKKKDP